MTNNNCPLCGLPRFDGAAVYAGLQCKCDWIPQSFQPPIITTEEQLRRIIREELQRQRREEKP